MRENSTIVLAREVTYEYSRIDLLPWPRRVRHSALKNVTLSVANSRVLGIVGPNGSGKSTLILVILGALKHFAGSITVFGQAPGVRDVRRRTGYSGEEPRFFPRLSGKEVLRLHGALHDMGGLRLRERIEEVVSEVGLDHAIARRVDSYSKGMRKRLAIAQALLHDPDLLLLDEPFEGLDPVGCLHLRTTLRERANRGAAVLITSHRLSDLERLCDDLCVLRDGRVALSGTSCAVLERDDQWSLTIAAKDRNSVEEIARFACERGHEVIDIARPRRALEELFLDDLEKGRGG